MLAKNLFLPLTFLLFPGIPLGGTVAQEGQQAPGSRQNVSGWNAPTAPTLPAGTAITVFVTDTITSRHNKIGEQVAAKIAQPVFNSDGEVVVPAHASVVGVISGISSDDDGRLELTFYSVTVDGTSYPIQARIISLPTRKQRRGNTAGDAAKVGVGAVVGGIFGRIVGGDEKGTIIGAGSGAAAGVGVAAATRKDDIVLDAGTQVILVLTAPLVL